MVDPETWKILREWGLVAGGVLGSAAAGWKFRGRRESQIPVYSGPPDDHPRKITRKEWHDRLDKEEEFTRKITLNEARLDSLTTSVTTLGGKYDAFSLIVTRASEALARLEERVAAHIERWEEGSERAQRDREEILRRFTVDREEMVRRFDNLDRKLEGPRSRKDNV